MCDEMFTEFRKLTEASSQSRVEPNVLMFFLMFRNVRFFLPLLEHYVFVVARGDAYQAMPRFAYQNLSNLI